MCCRVKTCCCGVSLKNGTATIGFLGIFANFINIISVSRQNFDSEYRISNYCGAAVAVLFSVLLLVATYNKTITSTTRRGLVLSWLIFNMIGIIVLIVASIAFIAMGSVALSSPYEMKNKDEDEEREKKLIGSIYVGVGVGCLIVIAPISISLWIVVHSYYQELKEQNSDGELPQRKKDDVV